MKFRTLLFTALAAAALLFAAFVLPAPASAADLGGPPQRIDAKGEIKSPLSCFAGAAIGANLTTTALESGGTRIDIGSNDVQGSIEGGCDFRVAAILSIGGLGRYVVTNAKASILGTDAEVSGIWQVAGKATYHLNTGADIYGLLGYSGASFKIDDLNDSRRGWLFGAGIELKIADSPLSLFGEWNRTMLKAEDIAGVSITPTVDQVLIGARFRLNN